MWTEQKYRHYLDKMRSISKAKEGDDKLGPLKLLPGVWKNEPNLPGRGWNMIAVPFDKGPFNYRLLLNQYNEELKFSFVDDAVPNRGVKTPGHWDDDQFIVALDYEQTIVQVDAVDSPESGKAGGPQLPIHHEPGLWLHMLNKQKNKLDIARLGTIPHGNAVLALGESKEVEGGPEINEISGLPIGVAPNLESPYLAPYKEFPN